ncbi:MAG: DinB family protein [Ignavibacteriae bacterium]|nr:MAG: DinB family protein [Ignavibacteriota bacterium]
MPINESLIAELQQEASTTRKILERVPFKDPNWKPHEKSMAIGQLAVHVAELPNWINATLEHDELDFAKSEYNPPAACSGAELVEILDKNVASAMEILKKSSDEHFMTNWTLRNGKEIYFTLPKIAVLRSMVYNHIIHHRAQLGVYLRLLGIPLPGSYGPSADEQMN